LDAAIAVIAATSGGKEAGRWHYRYADNSTALVVVRIDGARKGKTYRPIRPHADGWAIGDPAGPLPLYRLGDLADANPVYLVEGEKCADAARSIGLTATTSAHGAKSPAKSEWTPLAGKEVILVPDNDAPGRKYAETVAGILSKLDPPAKVRFLELPCLPAGGDIADFLDARDSVEPEALRQQIETLADAARVVEPELPGEPVLVRLSEVAAERVSWLWPDRIPLAKVVLVAGDPGLGKSFVTLDLAARVTTGRAWPAGEPNGASGSVVILTAEDGLADTVRPRLDAAGGDVRRIVALETVRHADPDTGRIVLLPFNLERDIPALERAIAKSGNCRLVIIDPISAYCGRTDSHKNAEIRALLAPLADLAAKHQVTVLAVTHLNKASTMPAIYRAMGSLAFVAAARAVWAIARDKNDPTGRRRLFFPVKNNLGDDETGMAYAIQREPGASAAVVNWEHIPFPLRADNVLSAEKPDTKVSATAEAQEWLRDVLKDGPVPAKELKDRARRDGIASRTLDRAKEEVGVKTYRQGFGEEGIWFWSLSENFPKCANGPP
jgi:hypothetical protein